MFIALESMRVVGDAYSVDMIFIFYKVQLCSALSFKRMPDWLFYRPKRLYFYRPKSFYWFNRI